MRIVLALLLLLAQPVLAADCLRIVASPSPPQIVLRGVIDLKPASPPPGAIEVFLKLSTPICVEGAARNGFPFKKERVDSIKLGLPANLLGAFQSLDRVILRGELWGPAVNGGPPDDVMFAVREVL
jgi:hypothetical protein